MQRKFFILLILICLPAFVFSHGSHGTGVMAGFTHPIFGLDHNAAIVGVGILSYLIDAKRWYLFVIAFLVAMIVGGYLGIGNDATILVEKVIASSVLITGLAIAFRIRINVALVAFLLGGFGYFHGYAHGAEMPVETTALKYISGFSIGTLLLSCIGMLIGKIFKNIDSKGLVVRFIGGVLVGFGAMFLLL